MSKVAFALEDFDKPVIAAIGGVAVGAGMDISSMCDVRLASRSARSPRATCGWAPIHGGGCYLLPRLLGMPRALERMWTGGDEVHTLAMHMEAIPNARDWQSLLARAVELDKQVVVLRSGRSPAGRAAATSHTGAMIGHDSAFGLMCDRYGALEVDDLSTLLGTVVTLAPGRRMGGPGVAVVTSSGGAGCLVADQLDAAGLEMAVLAQDTRQELAELIPTYGSTDNPADVANAIVAATIETTKPAGVVWLAATEQNHEAHRILRGSGEPIFDDVAYAASAPARLRRRSMPRPTVRRPSPPEGTRRRLTYLLDEAARSGAWLLSEWQGDAALDGLGIARPDGLLVTDAQEAEAAAHRFVGPVVLKLQSPDILHKTEIGAVCVGVAADAAVVFEEINETVRAARPDAGIDGVLVQAMAAQGVELVIGFQGAHDRYPPVVTVGLGGVTARPDRGARTDHLPVGTARRSNSQPADRLPPASGMPVAVAGGGWQEATPFPSRTRLSAAHRLAPPFACRHGVTRRPTN